MGEPGATFYLLHRAYLALLRHPLDVWRLENQWLYAELRDRIAELTGQDAETIQNTYEAAVFSPSPASGGEAGG